MSWEQAGIIRIEGGVTSEFKIKKGVRQGCVLSSSLFNLYTEQIFREIGFLKGDTVGGANISNLRYADDTALLTCNEKDLQDLVTAVSDKGKPYGMEMNVMKTKNIIISRSRQAPKINISIQGKSIEQVENCMVYLGHVVTETGKSDTEIKRRIAIAIARLARYIGVIEQYDEEDFQCYLDRLEQCMAANDISGDGKKKAVFSSVVGSSVYGLLKKLLLPEKPVDKSYTELKEALLTHYAPRPIVIAERYRFYKRDQQESASVPDFVVMLKKLACTCEFGNFLDETLRDRFVCVLRSENYRRRLLTESNLTFRKAVEIARSMELARKDCTELQTGRVLLDRA